MTAGNCWVLSSVAERTFWKYNATLDVLVTDAACIDRALTSSFGMALFYLEAEM